MDIQSFFQLCDGRWTSQRTVHNLVEQKNQSARSELLSDFWEPTQPEVIELCQTNGLDPSLAIGGLQIHWSEVGDAYQSRFKPRNEGNMLWVPVMDNPSTTTGQLIRRLNGKDMIGTFSLGEDEAMSFTFTGDGFTSEERFWFASPNLRLRSSITRRDETVCLTTFCSEIRMIKPAPAEDAAAESKTVESSS
ncbi:MAG TPA: phycobiliprotein lyase [Stenomitos sp.]